MPCYCDSKKEFSECCEPFLKDMQKPSTPVQLMRSRYSAFVLGDGEYLVKTTTKENRYEDNIEIIKEFAKSALWLGLEVLKESENQVEFKAFYKEGNIINVLHEKSNFVREDGMWLYKDGILFNSKIERNEPCPCKSGKKYKKCCG
ncbi:MAG: YchJ family protein [Sulfurimonas sp.]|nr:YchJ family protein [Sulfurimonas sp.]